jgi:SAM-dependent methyltransferase
MSGSAWGREGVPLDRPSAARIYDWLLGGYHNFEADRAIGEKMVDVCPDVRLAALVNRAFLRRAVNLIMEEGIEQILDLGSGIPTVGNVHEAARAVNPAARVVYVDIDPVAVTHGRAMLADDDRTTIIRADVRQPDAILSHPEVRGLLDFDRPLGLLLVTILHYVVDDKEASKVVHGFGGALAAGSLMAIAHSASECEVPEMTRLGELFGKASRTVTRSTDRIERFFEGFELIEPGLVLTPLWRPEGPDDLLLAEPQRGFTVAGVGRKA